MALQKANASNQDNNQREPVTAWLNLIVVDADGNEHRVQKGLALDPARKLDRSLINAAKANPEAEFKLKGMVYVPDEEEHQKDFNFGHIDNQES